MQYMQEQDWAEFRKLFPGAMAWMNHRQLVNELAHLRKLQKACPDLVTKWKLDRLQDLEAWEKAVS